MVNLARPWLHATNHYGQLMLATLSPVERYRRDLDDPAFSADPAQAAAVEKLQDLYLRLNRPSAKGSLQRLRQRLGMARGPREPVRGLYFWGGVGRGKTYLMDLFYESLPFQQKLRVHFHRFMRGVHQALREQSGTKNPLDVVAGQIAERARVICFDEFFVSDITDAMLLSGLFESLFARGVCLVATSNIAPDGLYRDGLQRARFLPAIELLKRHTEVVNVDGGVDYRLRTLERAELYHYPLDAAADESLMDSFRHLAPEPGKPDAVVDIEGRAITARFLADDVVWFDFEVLCGGPRSQNDYIELAREFHAVLVSNVPQMSADNEDKARRFINMVDEFYDRSIKVVLSAAVPLESLYSHGRLAFEFERTRSRLREMQSHDYLAAEHKA